MFIWGQPFHDQSGETFSAEVIAAYKAARNSDGFFDGYEHIYIAGDLPIMERAK